MYTKSKFLKYIPLLLICLNLFAQKPLEIEVTTEKELKIEKLKEIIQSNPQTVDLSNKGITKEILEKIIPDLKQCRVLNLRSNQLESLPESIGNLINLNKLWLGENQLESLPESIGNLINLNNLNLPENQLTSLPESIGNLKTLEWLRLDKNRLPSLPESIGNLTKLIKIQLDNQKTNNKETIIQIPKSLDKKELEIEGNYKFIVPENQKPTANIVILLDREDQRPKSKKQDATQNDMDVAINNITPILVSGQILKNYLERKKEIPDIYEIFKLNNSDLYLLLPRGISFKNAFNLENATETSVKKLNDSLNNWPNDKGYYNSDNWLEGIKSIFKRGTVYWWNIVLMGHGSLEKWIAGLSSEDFKGLIGFLNSSDLNIFLFFYDTCFGGGSTLVNIYKTMKESIADILPLKFMVISGTTRERSSHSIFTDFSDLFNKLQNLLNFEKLNKEQQEKIGSDPIDALLKIIKKNVIDQNLTIDIPLIKFPNTQFFISVRKDTRVKVINNVLVKKHQLEKTPIEIDEKIKAIFVYPNIIDVPINIKGSRIPQIVSLDPGATVHCFSKIKTKNSHNKLIQNLFSAKKEKPEWKEKGKIFIVKELINGSDEYIDVVVNSESNVAFYKKYNFFYKMQDESETFIKEDVFKKEITKILQKNINLYYKNFPDEEITYIPVAPWKTDPNKLINYINKKLNITILTEEELKIEKLRKIIQNNPIKVYLGNERITRKILEKIIPELEQCEFLDLSFNKLSSLPDSIGNLKNLTRLYLRYNKLTELPDSIGNLKGLQELSLWSNKLSSIPESIGVITNLQELSLSNNKLSSLPESIGNLTNLQTLDLAMNNLSSLPNSIGNLTNLTTLYLNNNQLTLLPENIGDITNLTILELQYNKLTELPESIGNLKNLIRLNLPHNQLTKLPGSISNLKNLKYLSLSHNQFTELTENIGNLTNLKYLPLSHNQLTKLPESIGNLPSLQELNLQGNNLSSLPKSITKLTNLQTLVLGQNTDENGKEIKVKIPKTLDRKGLTIYGDYEFIGPKELKAAVEIDEDDKDVMEID